MTKAFFVSIFIVTLIIVSATAKAINLAASAINTRATAARASQILL